MSGLEVLLGRDQDGPRATLRFRVPVAHAAGGPAPLEVALLLAGDDADGDPVLALCRPPAAPPFFRSEPLPGPLFLGLKEVWERRQGEGVQVLLGPEDGPVTEVPAPLLALDFGGDLARGRAHEAAGRHSEALESYQRSASPTRDREVARAKALLAGTPPPEAAPLADEEAIVEILRAIAADGKVDAEEMTTVKALGQVFGMPWEQLRGHIDRVRAEPRAPGGAPMVAEDVMRDLVRRAAAPGRIGPESAQVLKRAARALGLTVAQVRAIVAGG